MAGLPVKVQPHKILMVYKCMGNVHPTLTIMFIQKYATKIIATIGVKAQGGVTLVMPVLRSATAVKMP